MVKVNGKFALSIEIECLTATPDNPRSREPAISRFIQALRGLAPSLAAGAGIFNGYAKVYRDVGHIEIAVIECDSPYLLTSVTERIQLLAARAVDQLRTDGINLLLANNNHSGLLKSNCPVWGDHENYLVEQHPSSFTDDILPFLVTRIYGGAGGVHFPSGKFVAAVRPICMALATGGGTTEMRAIHSTAREEHHMGPSPDSYRYHLILGDGHRSHFNLAVQFGATALAIKAILFDSQLRREIGVFRREFGDDWVGALQRLNVLAKPGEELRIDPLITKTQRLYLEGARRYAASLDDPPDWISRSLDDWEATLAAYQRLDRPWLSARLDTFAKYEFYSAVLSEAGCTWQNLPQRKSMFDELALLDHSYHEFCSQQSVFNRLEEAGVLHHRVCEPIAPGEEPDPHVPETTTRARARARFIRDNQNRDELVVDWSWIHDKRQNRRCHLYDPFASKMGPWERATMRESIRPEMSHIAVHLDSVLERYDRGLYEEASRRLEEITHFCHAMGVDLPNRAHRYRAWLQARTGHADAISMLDRIYRGRSVTWGTVTDYSNVHRFQGGLCPDLQSMEPWIEQGKRLLDAIGEGAPEPEDALVFREHVAAVLLRNGRAEEAMDMLEQCRTAGRFRQCTPRVRARLTAALGEAHRLLGNRREAQRLLRTAMRVQRQYNYLGHLAYFTMPAMAKCARVRRAALQWLAKASEIQTQHRDRLGHTTTLLLEARLCRDDSRSAELKQQITAYREQLPALSQCSRLATILDEWNAWTAGELLDGQSDEFWGL